MAKANWMIDEIEDEENEVSRKINSWLRTHGWEHTSETPGCIWLWKREWNEQTLLVDQTTARFMQSMWDRECQNRQEEPHVD